MTTNTIDRGRYTVPELNALADQGKLPGYLSETRCGPHLLEDTAWQPVLNIAFIYADLNGGEVRSPQAQLSVLTAIRRRESNNTHPDVVSTPTRRMTAEQASRIMISKAAHLRESSIVPFSLEEVNPSRPAVIASLKPNLEMLLLPSPLTESATELATTKLGMYDRPPKGSRELLRRYLGGFGISSTRILAGFSYVSETKAGEAQYEPILMFGNIASCGVIFPLTFPSESEDYRNISWTPIDDFAQNVAGRNVANLVVANEWDQVYACVRGLCLSTSVESTSNEDVWGHMGYQGQDIMRHYIHPAMPHLDTVTI